MKILVVEPNKKPYIKDIESSLEALEKIVGAPLGLIYHSLEDYSIVVACDATNKIKAMPFNRSLVDEEGKLCDVIQGTFCLVNTANKGKDMINLTDEQINEYKQKYDGIDPTATWFNHQRYFAKRKIKVIIFEPSKKPYVKELVLDRNTVKKIVGESHGICCHSADNEYVLFHQPNHIRENILFNFLKTYEDLDSAIKLYEKYRDTYIVCKPSKDGLGFESFNDEEIEAYIALTEKDEMIEVMQLAEEIACP